MPSKLATIALVIFVALIFVATQAIPLALAESTPSEDPGANSQVRTADPLNEVVVPAGKFRGRPSQRGLINLSTWQENGEFSSALSRVSKSD